VAPGAPAVDRLGKRFIEYWAPEWKGRVTAALDGGLWSLGLGSRYLGRYQDQGSSQRALGAFWVHDLNAQLKLERLGWRPAGARNATLALSVVNLGDRQPQLTDTSPFFDASQADWRGRSFGARLSLDW
jgi:iron complex outermembrane recepter protein